MAGAPGMVIISSDIASIIIASMSHPFLVVVAGSGPA